MIDIEFYPPEKKRVLEHILRALSGPNNLPERTMEEILRSIRKQYADEEKPQA
ncbi:hypothetical protein [Bradyrhizobium sp.]|jgi:hypothetical protein|uniref:hypothetical protein n=1 Tax=Bradyrhizobium sp. TaxID=376 RepID=UPI003C292E78